MKKIFSILVILISVPTLLFAQPKNNFELIKTDTIEGVIINEERGEDFYWITSYTAESFWTPTKEEVLKAEEKLADYLKEAVPNYLQEIPKFHVFYKDSTLWQDLPEYNRQYVGIVLNGDRKIWLNFFRKRDRGYDWKSTPLSVFGGGTDYFNLIYDINSDTFSHFVINAPE